MADILNLGEDNGSDPNSPPRDLMDAKNPAEQVLRNHIIDVLSTIYDPEIPVNIYELGLIYDILIDDENNVIIRMTLTSPACPVAGTLPGEVQQKVMTVPGVNNAIVELVWDPPYSMDMMSESARLQLGLLF
jgi:FeS assembly SUF system protein